MTNWDKRTKISNRIVTIANGTGSFGPGRRRCFIMLSPGGGTQNFNWQIGGGPGAVSAQFGYAQTTPLRLSRHDIGSAIDDEITVSGANGNTVQLMEVTEVD